jgi:hypothetical protein
MADAYEREAMPGVGEVLHRQRITSPRWLMALSVGLPILPGLGLAASMAASGLWGAALGLGLGALGLGAMMSFLMVFFATTRIAVSEGELELKMGMFGPRIPISEIASVSIGRSGTNSIGMGAMNDLRGTTIYKMWGDNERAVHVTTNDGKKRVFVCKEPDAMAAALEEAIARRDRKHPQVRVGAVETEGAVEDEATAEAERRARR